MPRESRDLWRRQLSDAAQPSGAIYAINPAFSVFNSNIILSPIGARVTDAVRLLPAGMRGHSARETSHPPFVIGV